MAERPEYKPFLASECEVLNYAKKILGRKYNCEFDCQACPVVVDDRVFPKSTDVVLEETQQTDTG